MLQCPKPWDMDILHLWEPSCPVGMAKAGAAQLLEVEWPPCPACSWLPSFVMLEGQKGLLATLSLDGGGHPAAAPHRRAQG